MNGDIIVLDNFLSDELYGTLAKYILGVRFKYGRHSNHFHDPHGHWGRNLGIGGRSNLADISSSIDEKNPCSNVNAVWNTLSEKYIPNSVLIRCYVNGYTYGTDGYFHTDSKRPDDRTAIIYMNDIWEPDWAGETTFIDDRGEIITAVLPRKNRAVIFPANIMHAGRSVSRKCNVLRTTLIYKTRKKRSESFERLSAFLRKAGAVDHQHKKGSLHDHLVRTFALLEDRGAEESVCFGGGLHSIYGTNAYSKGIIAPDGRAGVAEEFGSYAEQLAYLFSTIDRPKSLESPPDPQVESVVVRLRDNTHITIPRKVFDDLRKIECANLIDQNAIERYSALKSLW